MEFQIIPKQDDIPSFDSQAINFAPPYKAYDREEITEKVIAEVLKKISGGINIYLYLDPDGEDNWLEINCDGEWISLGFSGDFGHIIPLLLILPAKSIKGIFQTKAYIPAFKAAVSRPFLKFKRLQILKWVSRLESCIQESAGYISDYHSLKVS